VFALINEFGKLGDLIVDLRLITFQPFQCAVMWQVKEGLSDLVAINLNQKENQPKVFEKVGIQNGLVFISEL
jgi:hypothetical protein